ncbi:MAG: hypothetical protein HY907_08145 [Deltaproteobacteria bacterium]|nr:hypothetical protein [Deltaproteobacteria bacterium]
MSAGPRLRGFVRWTVRLAGLAVFFLVAAAPLPGDTPGCDAQGAIDESAALFGDAAVRSACGQHCMSDCTRLVECGRYPGPAGGPGYTACLDECVIARTCTVLTFDGLCPLADYGEGRVITENELADCLADAVSAACWCDPGEDCWDPAMPTPFSCTAGGLCDPR